MGPIRFFHFQLADQTGIISSPKFIGRDLGVASQGITPPYFLKWMEGSFFWIGTRWGEWQTKGRERWKTRLKMRIMSSKRGFATDTIKSMTHEVAIKVVQSGSLGSNFKLLVNMHQGISFSNILDIKKAMKILHIIKPISISCQNLDLSHTPVFINYNWLCLSFNHKMTSFSLYQQEDYDVRHH